MVVKRANKTINLTPQEIKILEYLLANKGNVLSREMILSRLWKTNPDIETRVVDVYIGYLRKKIDAPFKQKLIHSVRGFGYKISTEQ
jgi:DNA-binding response OmpR family regulator